MEQTGDGTLIEISSLLSFIILLILLEINGSRSDFHIIVSTNIEISLLILFRIVRIVHFNFRSPFPYPRTSKFLLHLTPFINFKLPRIPFIEISSLPFYSNFTSNKQITRSPSPFPLLKFIFIQSRISKFPSTLTFINLCSKRSEVLIKKEEEKNNNNNNNNPSSFRNNKSKREEEEGGGGPR